MSVILDALRKSEHERQRSAVPGLAQVPTATPRTELPRWALILIGALGAAVLALGGAWLQSLRGAQQQTPATRALEAPAPVASPPSAAPTNARAEPVPLPAAAVPAVAPAPNNTAPVPARTPAPARPMPEESPSLADFAAANTRMPGLAPTPTAASSLPAPAAGAAASPASTERRSEPTLPSAAALMAQGISLPPLKLELHAYAAEPTARFVFINGRKYVEGQRLAEGPEVAAIAPNGAVLSYLGQRFILAPE